MTTLASVTEPEALDVAPVHLAPSGVLTEAVAPTAGWLRWLRANPDRALGIACQGVGAVCLGVGAWLVRNRGGVVTELGHVALFGSLALIGATVGAHLIVSADVTDLESVLTDLEDRQSSSPGAAAHGGAPPHAVVRAVIVAAVALTVLGALASVVGGFSTFAAESVADAVSRAGVAAIGVSTAAVGLLLPVHTRIRTYRLRLHRLLDDLERREPVSAARHGGPGDE